MKKQISLLALTAASVAVASAPAIAAPAIMTPGPGYFVPADSLNQDGSAVQSVPGNASEFSVSGTIEEFLQITSVDDDLELGDLAGPQFAGTALSTVGELNENGIPAADGLQGGRKAVDNDTDNGTAGVTGRSNTYLQVSVVTPAELSGDVDLVNGGNYKLPVQFRTIAFSPTGTRYGAEANYFTNRGSYTDVTNGYTPAFNGAASVLFAPGETMGAKMMAEVTRDGLNDREGTYSGQIDLTYYKF
jgi:hypothetical protein